MYGFNKTRRLLKKSEYDYVFKQATKLVTPEFIVLYRCNDSGYARLGLALSKKVIPKAHDRNRLKRSIRETFRLKQLPAVDIVILGRQGVSAVQNKTITTNLSKAWDKLSALCGT